MLYQHCILTKIAMLPQCCPMSANVQTTFRQCHSPTLENYIKTMFRQRCVYVVATSLLTLGTDIETTLCECCVNIGAQHWRPTLRQRSGNIVWPFWPSHFLEITARLIFSRLPLAAFLQSFDLEFWKKIGPILFKQAYFSAIHSN